MTMFDIITKCLLVILLVLQIGAMIYLFYINHKRFEEDKKFWAHLDEEVDKARRRYQQYLDEHPLEDVENEQTGDQK